MTKRRVRIAYRSETIEIEVKKGRVRPLLGVSLMPIKAHGLGQSRTSKQNVLSLILLILLAKLTNQKKGICRYHILYPLQLGPSFPNDAQTLRPNASLEPNHILN